MKIWYDVTDLVGWNRPHLTGIQRSSVGILNGLVEQGVSVGLVRYNARSGVFSAMCESELPATVRCHLRGFAPAESSASVPEATEPGASLPRKLALRPSRRKVKIFKKGLFFGSPGESAELRQAFRQFKTAVRVLRRSFGLWVRRRMRRAASMGLNQHSLPSMREAVITDGAVRLDVAPFAASGDVLLSLGATWVLRGYAEAVSSVRRRGVKVVRMVFDIIPTIKPQWVEPAHTRDITAWVRSVLSESDHVLTISDFSRHEIARYCEECRFPMPPLSVVRLGDVLGEASGGSTPSPLPRFAPTRPFFICVSTLDVRKNHRLLYDAWTQLAARRGDACPDLLCIGMPHLHVDDLLHEIRQDRNINRHIHVLNNIEDTELEWYYQHCQATIYPSKYEGWGLPVAESLGHGRLCLASNATSIPEISRTLPEFFDPYDVYGLVTLIERVLNEPNWVRLREEKIRSEFRPTPWTETAAQVLAAIEAPVASLMRVA